MRRWSVRLGRVAFIVLFMITAPIAATAAPQVEQLGPRLYAYISDNDGSANSTFLVGESGILVVDTGLNRTEGEKLLREIRKLSDKPIEYIINTHYHPDHQGANGVVGPNAIVISSPFTRERTLALAAQIKAHATAATATGNEFAFRAATETFTKELTIYLGDDPVEIYAAWPAHTMGDVYVYFANQRAVACGDIFMNNASPAMDQGSAEHWIEDLNTILTLRADHFVPGHFAVGTRETIQRFRDYMADLYKQVEALSKEGESEEQVRQKIQMRKYADFRQYPKYEATFADNAASIYRQLHSAKPAQ